MMVCGRGVLGDGKYTHLAHLRPLWEAARLQPACSRSFCRALEHLVQYIPYLTRRMISPPSSKADRHPLIIDDDDDPSPSPSQAQPRPRPRPALHTASRRVTCICSVSIVRLALIPT